MRPLSSNKPCAWYGEIKNSDKQYIQPLDFSVVPWTVGISEQFCGNKTIVSIFFYTDYSFCLRKTHVIKMFHTIRNIVGLDFAGSPSICTCNIINVDSMLFRIFFIYLSDGCSTTVFVWAALYLYNVCSYNELLLQCVIKLNLFQNMFCVFYLTN